MEEKQACDELCERVPKEVQALHMHQLVVKNVNDLLIVQICINAFRHDHHRLPHVFATRRTKPPQLPKQAPGNPQSAALFNKDLFELTGREPGLGYGIAE